MDQFDPDQYLQSKGAAATFDPDAYLNSKQIPAFDADSYLASKQPIADPIEHAATNYDNPAEKEAAFNAYKTQAKQPSDVMGGVGRFIKSAATTPFPTPDANGQWHWPLASGAINLVKGIGQTGQNVVDSTGAPGSLSRTLSPLTGPIVPAAVNWWNEDPIAERAGRQLSAGAGEGVMSAAQMAENLRRNASALGSTLTGGAIGNTQAQLSDEDLRKRFDNDVQYRYLTQQAQKGITVPEALSGQTYGLSPEQLAAQGKPVDPQAIENIGTASNPANLVELGALTSPTARGVMAPAVSGIGKVLTGAANVADKIHINPAVRTLGAAEALFHGNPLAAAGALAAPVVSKGVGAAALGAGDLLTGAGEEMAGGQIPLGQSAATKIVKEGIKGAASSVPTAAAFAATGGTPEEAGQQFGNAVGLGTLLSAASAAPKSGASGAIERTAAGQQLASEGATTNFGTGYDAWHQEGMQSVSPQDANEINKYRGFLGRLRTPDGKPIQVYAVKGDKFGSVQKQLGEVDASGNPTNPNGKGLISPDGSQIFVNVDSGNVGEPLGHETGHAADLVAKYADSLLHQSLQSSIAQHLYSTDPQGNVIPTKDFADFRDNYQRAVGQKQMSRQDFEAEYVAETARKILGGQNIENFTLPKSLGEKVKDGINDFMSGIGIKPTEGKLGFGGKEISDITRNVSDLLRQPNAEPAPTSADYRIDQLKTTLANPPGRGATIEQLDQFAAAKKEYADLLKKKDFNIPGASDFPASGRPPVAPSAPQAPKGAMGDIPRVAAYLRQQGIPATEAMQWANKAQGGTVEEKVVDALKQRANQKFPNVQSTPPIPNEPIPASGGAATEGNPTATQEAPKVEQQTAVAEKPAPLKIKQAAIKLQDGTIWTGATHAMAEQNARDADVPNSAFSYRPESMGFVDSQGQYRTRQEALEISRAAKQISQKTADESSEHYAGGKGLEAVRFNADQKGSQSDQRVADIIHSVERQAVSAERNPNTKAAEGRIQKAKIDAILSDIGDDNTGLHKETDAFGNEKIIGDYDPSDPRQKALADLGGLKSEDAKKIQQIQDAKGGIQYVRYRSALSNTEQAQALLGKAERGDVDTGMDTRQKEYSADPASERTEGTIQHKVMIPVGTQMNSPSGRITSRLVVLDNILHNFASISEGLKEIGRPNPYGETAKEQEPLMVRDAQVYAKNHAHGYKGDGSGPMEGFPDSGLPSADPNYTPQQIPADRFSVLNMAFHNEGAGRLSAVNERIQKYQAENKPVPKSVAAQQAKAQELYALASQNNPWVDHQTGETNQLRSEMKAAGFDTDVRLKSPFETLSPQHILETSDKPIPLKDGDIPSVRPHGFDVDPAELGKSGLPREKAVGAAFLPEEDQTEPLTPSRFLSNLRRAYRDSSANQNDSFQSISNLLGRRDDSSQGVEGEANREDQKKAIADWAKENGKALYSLPRNLDYNSENNIGGVEHDVWFDGPSQRYIKVTKPSLGVFPSVKNGKWTLSASTPAQYLDKLQGLKEFSGIDTNVEGVLLDKKDNPSFIVSQPSVQGKALSQSEIDQHMKESGFQKIDDDSAAYYRPSDNFAAFDAHPGNMVESGGKAIAFDGVFIHPTGELKSLIEQEHEAAIARKQPVKSTGSFLDAARANMAETPAQNAVNFLPTESTPEGEPTAPRAAETPPEGQSASPLSGVTSSEDTGKPEEGATPVERLAREAEEAGVFLSMPTLRAMIRNDQPTMDKIRARIQEATGKPARFLPVTPYDPSRAKAPIIDPDAPLFERRFEQLSDKEIEHGLTPEEETEIGRLQKLIVQKYGSFMAYARKKDAGQ